MLGNGPHKMIGTSRNNQIIAPAGTKNKVGGTGAAHIHTALVNLGNSSIGASIDEMGGLGSSSQILNRTLGGSSTTANRYF